MPEYDKGRILSAIHLRSLALWSGSALESDFRYRGIRREAVEKAIAKLEMCDDLTDNEIAWLDGLRKTLET